MGGSDGVSDGELKSPVRFKLVDSSPTAAAGGAPERGDLEEFRLLLATMESRLMTEADVTINRAPATKSRWNKPKSERTHGSSNRNNDGKLFPWLAAVDLRIFGG